MKDKDLNAFLASVRRTRFVDYLDPLGETAQNAFERRLSWARVSQHDPAYADEARFLLDNAEDLRELLRRELEEDDWIEEADVGREWETRAPSRASRMRENDRITEIFQPDDLDTNTGKGQRARSTPLPKPQRSSPGPSAAPSSSRSSQEGAAPRAVALTDRARGTDSGAPARQRMETPAAGQRGRDERIRDEIRGRDEARSLQETRIHERGRDRERSSPALNRSTPAPVGSGLGGGLATPAPQERGRGRTPGPAASRSPVAERSSMGERSGVAERAKLTPAPASSRSLEGGFRDMPPGRGVQQGDDEQTLRLGPNGAPEEVDFDDWDAPEDPISSTGIMRIEDITDAPAKRGAMDRIDTSETVARPLLRNSAQPAPVMVIDEVSTAPSAATRLRRPGESSVGSVPRVRASVQDPPRRSRIPLVLMLGVSLLGVGVLLIGGAALVPTIYTQTDGFKSLGLGMAPPPPQPVVPSEPIPLEPPPEPQAPPGSPEPGAPSEAPPGAPGSPAPGSGSVGTNGPGTQPAPSPSLPPASKAPPPAAPEPAKAKATKVATPEPQVIEGPTEMPDSTAAPLNVEGLWVGSTNSGRSFKLTVLGQTEGNFEGTVEVQLEDGTFSSLAIFGKVDGAGAMTFKGEAASFQAKINGRKATGTVTLDGKRPEPWTAYGGK
jgi:hypothetical protein